MSLPIIEKELSQTTLKYIDIIQHLHNHGRQRFTRPRIRMSISFNDRYYIFLFYLEVINGTLTFNVTLSPTNTPILSKQYKDTREFMEIGSSLYKEIVLRMLDLIKSMNDFNNSKAFISAMD
jgi:hypothetical protein